MERVRTVVVTGANRGIGREVARELAGRGFRVVMACRKLAAAERTRAEILAETGHQDIHVLELDLASRASIENFVRAFADQFQHLDILVNNAGVSSSSRQKTVDGYELNVGTNFVGTYLLTMRLLPLFAEGLDRRIINLTSNISVIGGFKISRINGYRWFKAYAVSKRMLLLFTHHLARELEREGFSLNAVHPGVVATDIMFTGKWFDVIIRALCGPFFITPAEGARPIVALAVNPDSGTDRYYLKMRETRIRLSRKMEIELRDLLGFCRSLNIE